MVFFGGIPGRKDALQRGDLGGEGDRGCQERVGATRQRGRAGSTNTRVHD